MNDLYDAVMESVKNLSDRLPFLPRVGLVTGTGLGEVDDTIDSMHAIPYEDIPHFPRSTAPGHAGNLLLGRICGEPVAVLQGRLHFYEGHSTKQITFPVRVLAKLGIEMLIVTNAAGGLNPLFQPGDIMGIVDHLHLIPENPLRGLMDKRLGNPFPDMSRAYDPDLIGLAEETALGHGIRLTKGVYAGIPGPSLETPSETRLLRAAGADAVGMSTTPEVIVARSLDLRVLGLSVISNVNRPDCMAPILVEDILSASQKAFPLLVVLLQGICKQLHSGQEST